MDVKAIRVSTFEFGIPIKVQDLTHTLSFLYRENEPSQNLIGFVGQIEAALKEDGFYKGKYEKYQEDDRQPINVLLLEDKEDSLLGLKVGMGCSAGEDKRERELASELGIQRGLSAITIGVELHSVNWSYKLDMNEILAVLKDGIKLTGVSGEAILDQLVPKTGESRAPRFITLYDGEDYRLSLSVNGEKAAPHMYCDSLEFAWKRDGTVLTVGEVISEDQGSVFELIVQPIMNAGATMRGEHWLRSILSGFAMPVIGEKRQTVKDVSNNIYLALAKFL